LLKRDCLQQRVEIVEKEKAFLKERVE